MLPNILFFSSDGELIGITLEGIDNIESLDYIYKPEHYYLDFKKIFELE